MDIEIKRQKQREADKRYYNTHKEKVKEKNSKYVQDHRELVNEKVRNKRLENPEIFREKDRSRYEKCSDVIKQRVKTYRESHKEQIRKTKRKNYEKNIETIKERNKKYRNENLEELKEKKRLYRIKNIEKIKIEDKNRNRKKLETDPIYRLKKNLRRRINLVFKKYNMRKTKNTNNLIGCSPEFLREHLEAQFKEGMTHDNHNPKGWHIDHIIPLASAGLDKEKLENLCHYTNLQPLWWWENLEKSDNITNAQPDISQPLSMS